MALDQETEQLRTAEANAAQTPELAPEPPAVDGTQFSTQGPVPEVSADGTAQESASEQAYDHNYGLDTGVHEWDIYKAQCEYGCPSKWKPEFASGWTSSTAFKQPADHGKTHTFELEKGKSASSALQEFMQGLTVTDWFAYRMGVDLLDLLDLMGIQAFDRMFGSTDLTDDRAIPESHRLIIASNLHKTTWVEKMRDLAFAAPQQEVAPQELKPVQQEEEEIAEDKTEAETHPVAADEMMMTEREREQVS